MSEALALEMRGITKTFGSIVANKDVDLKVRKGEILAILGENGSGKTTLMNMVSGIYFPDEGEIFVNGEPVVITSPKDAFGYKIGMIHQHFKLIDVFTATENIVLGIEDGKKFNIKVPNIYDNLESINIPGTGTRARPLCKEYYDYKRKK